MTSRTVGALHSELHRWLFDRALPLWWEVGADRAGGGFYDSLDDEGRPMAAARWSDET